VLSFLFIRKREKIMPTKLWLKPEQLDLYIKHLERFRDLYSNGILNRYVRRFIPKERKIETVSAKELDQINHWINARPMKTLNWQSPRKVFQQFAVFG